jgi:hypothetical protein
MLECNANTVLVRYNTESDGKVLLWRLLIDGKEYLANSIRIEVPSHTSTDWLEDKQVFKHHITVTDCIVYIDNEYKATLRASNP